LGWHKEDFEIIKNLTKNFFIAAPLLLHVFSISSPLRLYILGGTYVRLIQAPVDSLFKNFPKAECNDNNDIIVLMM
jgi:hypothetical protein